MLIMLIMLIMSIMLIMWIMSILYAIVDNVDSTDVHRFGFRNTVAKKALSNLHSGSFGWDRKRSSLRLSLSTGMPRRCQKKRRPLVVVSERASYSVFGVEAKTIELDIRRISKVQVQRYNHVQPQERTSNREQRNVSFHTCTV